MNAWNKYRGIAYLALLVVALPWTVWSLSLSDTWAKYRAYQREGREVEQLRNRPVATVGDALPMSPDDDAEMIAGGEFIRVISTVADKNKVAIDKYTPCLTHRGEGVEIMTAEVVLSGNFVPLVRMIDYIERDVTACRIVSADFRSTTDRRTGNIKLAATIIVQQIKTE